MARPDNILRDVLLGSQRRAVAFVGSGLSSNHPDWPKLLCLLAKDLPNKSSRRALCKGASSTDVNTLLAVADECRSLIGGDDDLQEFMRRTFKTDQPAGCPEVFRSLVHAPFAFYMTTNYDTNIEDAYRDYRGVALPVVRANSPHLALRYMAEGKPFVFKIHGCARDGGPFVLGATDYRRITFGTPMVQVVLQAIFATHPIVFMGYGQRDPHINSYLLFQKEVMVLGQSLPRLTFVERKSLSLLDYVKYHQRVYGTSSYVVESWDEIKQLLDQYSFLQLRDNSARVRKERSGFYDCFLAGKVESAWDALLYATASSDLGYIEKALRLRETINANKNLLRYIQQTPVLHLIYHLVSGQTLKRQMKGMEAAQEFEHAAEIALRDKALSPPLRALALRYAGIFHMSAYGKGLPHTKRLFAQAEILLRNGFPEESLDQKKWMAILNGELDSGGHLKAARKLLSISKKADDLGYLKCAAWCRFNLVDQRRLAGRPLLKHRDGKFLNEAIVAFETLEHYQGLAYSNLLWALMIHEKEGLTTEVEKRTELARAFSVVTGDRGSITRCDDFLAMSKVGKLQNTILIRFPG